MFYNRITKKGNLLIIVMLCFSMIGVSQTVTNGTFSSGTSGWGCSPETNPVSVYGGVGSDQVAEVDAQAGLCQTISGFTVGSIYRITFLVSRRTTCGPSTQTMAFSINGGALSSQEVSRTGSFNFTTESFNFTATSTNHTIQFVGTVVGTCGLILDNISITVVSALPIELLNFDATVTNNSDVLLEWQTATENNNDYFTVEKSQDGKTWEDVVEVDGAGNSSNLLRYSTSDKSPFYGISYYRLKQTDFDGNFDYSTIKSVTVNELSSIELFPNPASSQIVIRSRENELENITIYNAFGQDVTIGTKEVERNEFRVVLNLLDLESGVYFVKTTTTSQRFIKQ